MPEVDSLGHLRLLSIPHITTQSSYRVFYASCDAIDLTMRKFKVTRKDSNYSPFLSPSQVTPWTTVGPAKAHLAEELERLYWDGVQRELQSIILTLQAWGDPEALGANADYEDDDLLCGFDTWVDQLSKEKILFATDYGILVFLAPKCIYISDTDISADREKKRSLSDTSSTEMSYLESLERVIRDQQADRNSARTRFEIREALNSIYNLP